MPRKTRFYFHSLQKHSFEVMLLTIIMGVLELQKKSAATVSRTQAETENGEMLNVEWLGLTIDHVTIGMCNRS